MLRATFGRVTAAAGSIQRDVRRRPLTRAVRCTAGGKNVSPIAVASKRMYHFASTEFEECLAQGVPDHDGPKLREDTVRYLDNFNPQLWYDDPVVTVLEGATLDGGDSVATIDAFKRENGRAINATSQEVDAVLAHMKNYKPSHRDYRSEVRAIEAEILSEYDAFLVGNQAMDFIKQDGVTEIEESVQANAVERRLNDRLFEEEQSGKLEINRAPAIVGCVSNFSNFLDLCRKTLRNLELGVPVVVLSRSNVTQHMFRWSQLLIELCDKHGVDKGMVTYLSASLDEQRRVFQECSPDSPMYFTCSRGIAEILRKLHGPVFSSTGGPNTLVATSLTPAVSEAVRMSATIENSGQCTALRHAVIPGITEDDVAGIFDGTPVVTSAKQSLKEDQFAGIFDFAGDVFEVEDGYKLHKDNNHIAFKHSRSLPGPGIDEHWRNVYADITAPQGDSLDESMVDDLSRWLVDNQPITLAVNAEKGDFSLAQKLFEQTGQVVYTVGTLNDPALTCQARPQEGEIFGEFPVRGELNKFTKYPVVVPSPTPAYNAHYKKEFLEEKGLSNVATNGMTAAAEKFINYVQSPVVRGFLVVTHEYLQDALAENPKPGKGARKCLYGLQTTPLNGQFNYLRCSADETFDDIAPHLFPFFITSSLPQLRVSVDVNNDALASSLQSHGISCEVEDENTFLERSDVKNAYNIIRPGEALFDIKNNEWPLIGQFISLYFCCGHIKAAGPEAAEDFLEAFSASKKWLKLR